MNYEFQKPKTLIEAATLADQYVAVHRPSKRVSHLKDGRGQGKNKEDGPHVKNKPEVSEVKTVDHSRGFFAKPVSTLNSTKLPYKKPIQCFNCRLFGHIASQCTREKKNSKGENVNLINSGETPNSSAAIP